jgi:hypothetical protein
MARTHQIERTPAGWYCRVCQWTWAIGPRGACPGLPRYAPDAVPVALQTKRQLRVAGLQPGGPVRGCYRGSDRRWQWLYAVPEAIPLVTAHQRAQQDRDWAGQQIARVARQVRARRPDAE